MSLNRPSTSLERAVKLIKKAEFSVALTGAGSSTPSGIPDFRSQGSGLWTRVSPDEVASFRAFRRNPERFFEWFRPLAKKILNAKPNNFHSSLAELEKQKLLNTIITQNIDGLHQRAGSTNVLQVHGTLDTLTCIECYQQVSATPYIQPYLDEGKIPKCDQCGNILKPDIILFDEQLPAQTWVKARQVTKLCDLMIIAGTSLVVYPVAMLPDQAKKNGAHIIVVNKSATYIDEFADIVLHGDVAEILPEITTKILNG